MESSQSLFVAVVPQEKLHPAFMQVATHPGWGAARRCLDEVYMHMAPTETNFVEQFQTTGFDQRVWELALFASLEDLGYRVEQPSPAPDFDCTAGGIRFFVEATTANAPMVEGRRTEPPKTVAEFIDRLRKAVDVTDDEVAIRFGSALHSKARRDYQKLEHVQGHPVVLAIEPFFDVGALWRAEIPLLRYLFGRTLVERLGPFEARYDDRELAEHEDSTKTIPSGFFLRDENIFISAVIFSNSHTVGKFNRMGVLKGYGSSDYVLIRKGFRFDPDPKAFQPEEFVYEVGTVEERWFEGLVVIHNPNAVHPLDRTVFGPLTQIWEEHGSLRYDVSPSHIYTSIQNVVRHKGSSSS